MVAIKNKLILRILFLVVVLGAISFLVFNENGIIKYIKMKSELTKMDSDIRQADERIKMLQTEIDSLHSSRLKIERVAREKFNMMKKNEKAFKIQEN